VVTSTEINLVPFEPLLLSGSVFFVFHFHKAFAVNQSDLQPQWSCHCRWEKGGPGWEKTLLSIFADFFVAPFWLPGEEAARGGGTGSVVL